MDPGGDVAAGDVGHFEVFDTGFGEGCCEAFEEPLIFLCGVDCLGEDEGAEVVGFESVLVASYHCWDVVHCAWRQGEF